MHSKNGAPGSDALDERGRDEGEGDDLVPDEGVRSVTAVSGLSHLSDRIDAFEENVSGQLVALTRSVRKVQEPIADSRLRATLLDIVGVLDQLGVVDEGDGTDELRGKLASVEAQLRQVLLEQEVTETRSDGSFDPKVHRAIDSRKVDNEDEHGRILECLVAGFHRDGTVLRYAEVVVARYAE